ncbi:preprotein translocase subunit : Protein translocase subunit SecY OS=Planctomyces limnophilus (strain ATCC 43296 / DSM 3776 / IFAM 1008 / 290) GN=secY PE=3 SV=1: SecY [Tuwongella immobilis]|uniref:Protein translocase subunit SecY n=2 Tax=Tuwongella immobilis TaxID=692036 RepID=A0A6C2YMP2_9BACT|nr:preprotein translocase subunit SecY [Tuwongella immobilis]VIP02706.1 preprotein translocase subunit : Protein translocase subunit SecY OS=Planctomyces limnophilus (strain ATCC 43296 / DSM 3776 / IFAM 1008 / 290) GN=secY PE=3 SV=1: SecY [Tuwongella immobilis]VTS02208.1 preprotein translocase subunit : Protein translocase subunit SecY OS=Planctomyces limnophilus (strain ATCC 43296 / DSM 3776 / IFAM 1008 / 290) GN=secY PE=3 SV=1: SecY [Tuwongella immobilis]
MNQLKSIFLIPELSKKIYFTLIILAVYRIGYFIPLPVVDHVEMAKTMSNQTGAFSQLLNFVSQFSGGNLSQACIFALGIMPYISASIIMQLLAAVVPSLERLQKEGEAGRKTINRRTRQLTVAICLVQSVFWVRHLMAPASSGGLGLAVAGYASGSAYFFYFISTVLVMTAGTMFLMWLGEQVDEYGIGNGISLIIMAGIVCRIPDATVALLFDVTETGYVLKSSLYTLGGTGGSDISFEKLMVLGILFIAVVMAVVAITKAQRRIPLQSARHVKGRRVYGGTRANLPLKVNQAGVMPVIFASSLLILPNLFFSILNSSGSSSFLRGLQSSLNERSWTYNVLYIGLIYFFCYFWTAIQFNPKDLANNLKEHGSFIPGYRPGKRTADYLEKVLMRITYVGAAFLAIIAIIPNIVNRAMDVDYRVASFYGGTGLLIVISVALDLVQKINSHLVMRNYTGLTDE